MHTSPSILTVDGQIDRVWQLPVGHTGSGWAAAVGDFNGDAIADGLLIVEPVDAELKPLTTQVYLMPGRAFTGGTSTPPPIAALAGARRLVPADVNSDGKLDLLVSFDESPAAPQTAFLGDGAGGFTRAR
jgi:hypothetical protein